MSRIIDNLADLDSASYKLVLDHTVKDACPRCKGTGRFHDRHNDTNTCPSCDGTGRVVQVEEGPEEAVTYFAISGTELIETGAKLDTFAEQQRRAWTGPDDLAIWREREGDGLRLVAVLYRDGRGNVAVRWL